MHAGMPYPQNLKTAQLVESTVRRHGATPATIAILAGQIHIGLSAAQLETLAQAGTACAKVSRRDIALVLAQRCNGATTVAATMLLAHHAGIRVFVTGGIGGVHRGAQDTFDVSADLIELGRTPVAVVCAGAKSVRTRPIMPHGMLASAQSVVAILSSHVCLWLMRTVSVV